MRYAILFLSLFSLIGCSSNNEEEQSVELSLTELEVEEESIDSFVEITANCQWTAQSDNKNVTLSARQGEGDTKLSFKVSANDEYDPRNYVITVVSMDNSSTAILKIIQKERKGFILENSGDNSKEIPAEGGSFTVIANTNIDDIEIQKPDWVSILTPNSRSLEKKQFHFMVMENTEGHERSCTIRIGKNEMSSEIYIKQEPYQPASFSVPDFKNLLFNLGKLAYDISIEPSYADMSGLSVISSDESVCIPSLGSNKLVLDFKKYGSANISVLVGDKILFAESVENLSPDFGFSREYAGEYFIGYEFDVEMTHLLKYFSFKSSNESVAKVTNGNHILVTGKGEATITARFDLLEKEIYFKIIGRDIEASSISLTPKEKHLKVRETFNLSYVVSPENTTDKTVKWNSDNESVAIVNDGKVVAISPGETYITAIASSGISDKCKVNVQPNQLKWFAGVCNTIPTTSDEIKALANNGIYDKSGTHNFSINEWRIFVICIPNGSILSNVSRIGTPGNYLQSSGVFRGTRTISVNIADNSTIDYIVYIFQVDLFSDEGTFTFRIEW